MDPHLFREYDNAGPLSSAYPTSYQNPGLVSDDYSTPYDENRQKYLDSNLPVFDSHYRSSEFPHESSKPQPFDSAWEHKQEDANLSHLLDENLDPEWVYPNDIGDDSCMPSSFHCNPGTVYKNTKRGHVFGKNGIIDMDPQSQKLRNEDSNIFHSDSETTRLFDTDPMTLNDMMHSDLVTNGLYAPEQEQMKDMIPPNLATSGIYPETQGQMENMLHPVLASSGIYDEEQKMKHLVDLMATSSICAFPRAQSLGRKLGQLGARGSLEEALMMEEKQRAIDYDNRHLDLQKPLHTHTHRNSDEAKLRNQQLSPSDRLDRLHDEAFLEDQHKVMTYADPSGSFESPDPFQLLLHNESRLLSPERALMRVLHAGSEKRSLGDIKRELELKGRLGLDYPSEFASDYAMKKNHRFGPSYFYQADHIDEFYPRTDITSGYDHRYGASLNDPYYRQVVSVLPHEFLLSSDPLLTSRMATGRSYKRGLGHSVRNPFLHGIDYNYGYGAIKPLLAYGLSPRTLQPNYGKVLDDLYLYEMMLHLDHKINEQEKLRRWHERLQWEELSEIQRRLSWLKMSTIDGSRLGLGLGSYWGHKLNGIPINRSFGYANVVWETGIKRGGLTRSDLPPGHFHPMSSSSTYLLANSIPGIRGQPHHNLSSALMSRYPMWSEGGLGLGCRISPWLRPKSIAEQQNLRRDHPDRWNEFPHRPRLRGPDLMDTGVRTQANETQRIYSVISVDQGSHHPVVPFFKQVYAADLLYIPKGSALTLRLIHFCSTPTSQSPYTFRPTLAKHFFQ
ncbi:hypothetical protein O181_055240 [Austropuccinia psidii MF-1]|uniref:Uncharacterized protein n=1 Tax=Austropuccinia psidii MF-1 TaxID=1389203 RepID=A0A9Q3EAC1_9BASI|nr:hypothetical protein [Austropuccinia psidii MF-1]